MKRTNLDYSAGLVRKADNDWKVVTLGLEHDAPLDTVCFHIQQTAEKLLKALLAWKGVKYPFTHDLRDLLDLAAPLFPVLEEFRPTLPSYSEFAVAMRYDDRCDPTLESTRCAYDTVGRLRTTVHGLLPPEARP